MRPARDEFHALAEQHTVVPVWAEVLGDLEDWRVRDLFRVANDLRAWIEVDDAGAITGHGYSGGGVIGSTILIMTGEAAFEKVIP